MEADVLDGFTVETLVLNSDYEGEVGAVLVSKKTKIKTEKAVLYIHGFADYFFNNQLADFFVEEGFDFYALDLRKYGRAILDHQHPNFCKDISEYFEEIDQAVSLIRERDLHSYLIINGHSTGGLTSSLYCHDRRKNNTINGLLLNSPWFDINESWLVKHIVMKLTYALGRIFPYSIAPKGLDANYARSLYKESFVEYKKKMGVYEEGLWDFNTVWKCTGKFPVYRGFLRAVRRGQKRLHRGLDIACPVLLLCSDKKGKRTNMMMPHYFNSDCVLNPDHMLKYIDGIGENIKHTIIKDGMHDLALSQKAVREKYFEEVRRWLQAHNQ